MLRRNSLTNAQSEHSLRCLRINSNLYLFNNGYPWGQIYSESDQTFQFHLIILLVNLLGKWSLISTNEKQEELQPH